MKKQNIIAIAIIAAVVVAAIVAIPLINLMKKDGAYVLVKVGGQEVARYSLSEDGEYSLNGGTKILKIENGEAWIKEATCKTQGDTRCTHQPKISKTHDNIYCQYYNVYVVVQGADESSDFLG